MPEFAQARGKRMLLAPELDKHSILSFSILKQLCSADNVCVKGNSKLPNLIGPHTVVLMTNFLSRIDFSTHCSFAFQRNFHGQHGQN